MRDQLFVSTRKGLFTIARKPKSWDISKAEFLGDNVTLTLTDPRDGRRYAALDHGHFGVKVHRSTATGWEEIATPVYPPKPEGLEENDETLEADLRLYAQPCEKFAKFFDDAIGLDCSGLVEVERQGIGGRDGGPFDHPRDLARGIRHPWQPALVI